MIYQMESHVAEKLIEFFNDFDFIDKVVVFGSRARHDCNPKSDIDLCIYSLEMSDEEFTKLKFEIDELPILYKLDIVHFEKSNKELKDNIIRDEKLLFNNYIKLEEVLEVQNGYAFNSKLFSEKDGLQLIRIRDLKSGIKTVVKFKGDYDEKYLVHKGDYLIGMDGDFICYEWKGEPSLLNQRVCRLQNFKGNIESKYIFYGINKILQKIHDSTSFVTVKHISSKQIKEIIFPIPTLTKQKEIASILDKAQELISLRKESIKKLDELSKSIFIDMFGDPVSNHKKFERGTIRDLILEAKYGSSQKSNENDGEFVMLRMNNITYSGDLNLESLKYVDLSEIDKSKYLVKKGDLLFNRTNSKELVGKTLVYNLDEPMAFAGYLIRIRTEHISTTQFISAFLNSKYGKQLLQSMAKAIVGMANINAQELQNIKILIPPIELQNKFANIIEKIEEQKSLYEEELEKLEENFKALLQKSFK